MGYLKNLFKRVFDDQEEMNIKSFEHQVKVLLDELPDGYCAFVTYYNKETGIGNHIGCEACTLENMIARAIEGKIEHDDGRTLNIVPIRLVMSNVVEKEIRH